MARPLFSFDGIRAPNEARSFGDLKQLDTYTEKSSLSSCPDP